MADQGKNNVAKNLLELQPTAILDFYRLYPDTVNHPESFYSFHGGTLFGEAIKWQGISYFPLAIEGDGFETAADGTLARPKIRIANKDRFITNLLQNFRDFINAKVVRQRAFMSNLDDSNFDGGNPFGAADPTAIISDEKYIIGQKLYESKVFVEFELNSPLDTESARVNERSISSKFCYWQYRGEGCRYSSIPIERDDGRPFLDADENSVYPQGVSGDFYIDPNYLWNTNRNYKVGEVACIENPNILLNYLDSSVNAPKMAYKTVYVCVSGDPELGDFNSGRHPALNPSYWQKDGCNKRLSACRKRFNNSTVVNYQSQGALAQTGFNSVIFSGGGTEGTNIPAMLYNTKEELTGVLNGDFTIAGWTKVNKASPHRGGIFNTNWGIDINPYYSNSPDGDGGDDLNQEDPHLTPSLQIYDSYYSTFLNFTHAKGSDLMQASPAFDAFEVPQQKRPLGEGANVWSWTAEASDTNLNVPESYQTSLGERWNFQLIEIFTDTDPESTTEGERRIRVYSNQDFDDLKEQILNRNQLRADARTTALVSHSFYGNSGARRFNFGNATWTGLNGEEQKLCFNGELGPWAVWNRVLSDEEKNFLYRKVRTPETLPTVSNCAPRLYHECTGSIGTGITGFTGAGQPAPYDADGKIGLVAWWEMKTGFVTGSNRDDPSTWADTGVFDVTPNALHLTGSGNYGGQQVADGKLAASWLQYGTITLTKDADQQIPRFGGFPGTDGFSYGEGTNF